MHWKVYSHILLVEMGKIIALFSKQHLFKLKNVDDFGPGAPFVGIYPREIKIPN